jgi:tRNA synthetases class I (E and Q), catalytic domain
LTSACDCAVQQAAWYAQRQPLARSGSCKGALALQRLVTGQYVRGWDDPRLPTLAGMRRRGLTPEGINAMCQEQGITRSDNEVQLKKLFYHARSHLNATSPRALVVLRPLRLVRVATWHPDRLSPGSSPSVHLLGPVTLRRPPVHWWCPASAGAGLHHTGHSQPARGPLGGGASAALSDALGGQGDVHHPFHACLLHRADGLPRDRCQGLLWPRAQQVCHATVHIV